MPATQSIGEEIERADVPAATTDMPEATLPQMSIFERETASTGVISLETRMSRSACFLSLSLSTSIASSLPAETFFDQDDEHQTKLLYLSLF